jgi:hypothetical protein
MWQKSSIIDIAFAVFRNPLSVNQWIWLHLCTSSRQSFGHRIVTCVDVTNTESMVRTPLEVEAREFLDSAPVQTGSGAHPASSTMGIGAFRGGRGGGGEQRERGFDHSFATSDKVNGWNCNKHTHIHACIHTSIHTRIFFFFYGATARGGP